MDSYSVEFSERFYYHVALILDDLLGFGPIQTRRHIEQIVERCEALDIMPHRGTPVVASGREYHRFRHGGHVIYYRVLEAEKRVVIEAVLRGRGSRDSGGTCDVGAVARLTVLPCAE